MTPTEHFLSQYTPATAKTNSYVLQEATEFIGKPLEHATQEDVIRYQDYIRGLAKNTQKRKLSTLSAWFKYAQARELVSKNPMAAIRLPKVDRASTIRWLKAEEANVLLDSLEGQECAIIAAALSGLRVSEIQSLNVEQFHDGRLWSVVGKGGKVRTVPLTTQAREAIEMWAVSRRRGPLFSLQQGRRISSRSIQNVVYEATEKVLGRRINPHALRHTLATMAAKADIPVAKIGQILGHRSADVTNIYLHLDDDDLASSLRVLDRPGKRKNHLKLVYSKAG